MYSDGYGKIATYGAEYDEYLKLLDDYTVIKVKAMRSKRVWKIHIGIEYPDVKAYAQQSQNVMWTLGLNRKVYEYLRCR